MTLAEKFHQWLNTEPFSSKDRPTLREAQCEQIADEYAIGFAEWVLSRSLGEDLKLQDGVIDRYKKEKGL